MKYLLLISILLLSGCTENTKDTVNWSKCYDNETVSQEYADRDFQVNFDNWNKNYSGSCLSEWQNRGDIIGCIGDYHYSFSCNIQ